MTTPIFPTPPLAPGRRELSLSRRPGRRAERGISLPELLIVLTLIALTALIAVTNLQRSLSLARLQRSADQSAAILAQAPAAALAEHAPVFVQWDAANGRLAITRDAAGTSVLSQVQLSEHVVVSGDLEAQLRCDTFGRAYVGTNPQMITSLRTLRLNYAGMLGEPNVHFELVLSPLWSVQVHRRSS